jgi:hypothetical protein
LSELKRMKFGTVFLFISYFIFIFNFLAKENVEMNTTYSDELLPSQGGASRKRKLDEGSTNDVLGSSSQLQPQQQLSHQNKESSSVAVNPTPGVLSSSSSATVLLSPLEKKIALVDPLVGEFHLLFLSVIDSLTLRSDSTRTNNNHNREEESEEQRTTSMDLSPVHNKNRSGSSVTPHKNKNRISNTNSSSIPPLINTNTTVTTACSSSSANHLLRSYSERILSLPFSSPARGHQSGSGADIRKIVSSLNNCFDEFYHSLIFSSVTDNNYPQQKSNNNNSYTPPSSPSPMTLFSLVQSLLDLSGLFWNDLFRFLSSSPGTSNRNSNRGSRTENTKKKTTNPPLFPGTASSASTASSSQQSYFSSFEVFYSSLKIIFLLFDDFLDGETIVEEEQDKDGDESNNGKQTGRETEEKRREEEDNDDNEKELPWLLSRVEIRSSSSSSASGEEQRMLETLIREAFGLEKPFSSSCSSLRVSVSSHWKRLLIQLVEFIHQITSDLFFLSLRSDLPTTDSDDDDDDDYSDSDEDNTDSNNTIGNQKNTNIEKSREGVLQRNNHNLTIFPNSADQQRFQENEEKLLELFLDLLLALKKLRYKTITVMNTKMRRNYKNKNNNNEKQKQQQQEELTNDRMIWMFVDLFQEDEDRLTDFFSCIISHSLLSFQLKDRAISLLQEILTTDIGYDYDFVVFFLIISLSRYLLVFFIPSFVFKAWSTRIAIPLSVLVSPPPPQPPLMQEKSDRTTITGTTLTTIITMKAMIAIVLRTLTRP